MEYEEAVNLILLHGIGRDDVPLEHALLPDGFLGSLRPYTRLREENFLQVLGAIIALAPHLADQDRLERRLVAGLWELIQRAQAWGLDPRGKIRRFCGSLTFVARASACRVIQRGFEHGCCNRPRSSSRASPRWQKNSGPAWMWRSGPWNGKCPLRRGA